MASEVDIIGLARRAMSIAGLDASLPLERIPQGMGNHVFMAGSQFVIRVASGYDARNFDDAVAVMRAAAGSVRVPTILFADSARPNFAMPVMILAAIVGDPLSVLWERLEPAQRFTAVHSICAELLKLHAIDAATIDSPRFRDPWWGPRTRFLEQGIDKARMACDFPSDALDVIERFYWDNLDWLKRFKCPAALHGDINWGNVLIPCNELARAWLIDFDDTRYGPPEEDFWQLLIETGFENEHWGDTRQFRELLGVHLLKEGALERHLIREIENIFIFLSGEVTWKSSEQARKDALETFEDAFRKSRFHRMLDQIARS